MKDSGKIIKRACLIINDDVLSSSVEYLVQLKQETKTTAGSVIPPLGWVMKCPCLLTVYQGNRRGKYVVHGSQSPLT
jgi:hypothetical protein